jgi:hypothetical protein
MEWSSVTPWLRSGVEERSHSNSVEWSGVVSGRSMELHGAPKGMSPNLIRHSYIPFWKIPTSKTMSTQSTISNWLPDARTTSILDTPTLVCHERQLTCLLYLLCQMDRRGRLAVAP